MAVTMTKIVCLLSSTRSSVNGATTRGTKKNNAESNEIIHGYSITAGVAASALTVSTGTITSVSSEGSTTVRGAGAIGVSTINSVEGTEESNGTEEAEAMVVCSSR